MRQWLIRRLGGYINPPRYVRELPADNPALSKALELQDTLATVTRRLDALELHTTDSIELLKEQLLKLMGRYNKRDQRAVQAEPVTAPAPSHTGTSEHLARRFHIGG